MPSAAASALIDSVDGCWPVGKNHDDAGDVRSGGVPSYSYWMPPQPPIFMFDSASAAIVVEPAADGVTAPPATRITWGVCDADVPSEPDSGVIALPQAES